MRQMVARDRDRHAHADGFRIPKLALNPNGHAAEKRANQRVIPRHAFERLGDEQSASTSDIAELERRFAVVLHEQRVAARRGVRAFDPDHDIGECRLACPALAVDEQQDLGEVRTYEAGTAVAGKQRYVLLILCHVVQRF